VRRRHLGVGPTMDPEKWERAVGARVTAVEVRVPPPVVVADVTIVLRWDGRRDAQRSSPPPSEALFGRWESSHARDEMKWDWCRLTAPQVASAKPVGRACCARSRARRR